MESAPVVQLISFYLMGFALVVLLTSIWTMEFVILVNKHVPLALHILFVQVVKMDMHLTLTKNVFYLISLMNPKYLCSIILLNT
jgi:hypothetical protein